MVELVPFLRAKAADTRSLLAWLERELATLRSAAPARVGLFDHLDDRVAEIRTRLSTLEMILSIGHPSLLERGLPVLHTIEATTSVLALTYLPALQRQGPEEHFLRGLLMKSAATCGMTWLEDILVRLEGPHAAFVAFPEFPIVYAPPRHAASLFDMPGLHHELGHIVFERFPHIGQTLSRTVAAHFAQVRRNVGPLSPAKRAAREGELRWAEACWSASRLNEVFCDVFATYACGPAHYVSFVDLGLRTRTDPFALGGGDPHPPLSARERVCHEALTVGQRREPVVELLRGAWQANERSYTSSREYAVRCDEALLEALTRESIRCVQLHLPGGSRYEVPTPELRALDDVDDSMSFEQILNAATALLFLAPERYETWEVRALATCRAIAATS